MDNHTIEILNKFDCATFPTGSRFICDPPVMNTDEDTVVFVDVLLRSSLDRELREYGFKVPYGREYDALKNDFTSYKKDEVNLIVTWKQEFYNKYVHATLCAKRLNLIRKEDRIKLFEGMIYERYGDMEVPGEEEEKLVDNYSNPVQEIFLPWRQR